MITASCATPSFETKTYTTTVATRKIVEAYFDREKFEGLCSKCPNCGTIWTCPPLAFPPLFIWEEYQELYLVCNKVTLCESEIVYDQETHLKRPVEEIESLKASAFQEAKRRMEDHLISIESKCANTRALFPGTCNRCERCQRVSRKPCIAPDAIRYSIEALGGDIPSILKEELGLEFAWAQKGAVPPYYLLVGGILS